MSMFDDRQKAFESKYQLDQEAQFKINSKSVRLFGLWAAAQLGFEGAEAEAYAQQVMDSDFDEPGIADFIGKVEKDLTVKGISMTTHHLENEFYNLRDKAASELAAKKA